MNEREPEAEIVGSPYDEGTPQITDAWLSETIGMIYDCVLEPERWSGVLGRICTSFKFANAVLGVVSTQPFVHQIRIHHGFDDEWLAAGDSYGDELVSLWGGPARVQSFPLDEPVLHSDIMPRDQLSSFRYFREILEPRGILEAVSIAVAREPHLVGYLALNRHESDGPVLASELDGIRLLAPHVRRAVTISNLFELRTVEKVVFQTILDRLRHPVLVVDEEARLLYRNAAAEEVLVPGGGISEQRGRVMLERPAAQSALEVALKLAAHDEAQLTQRGSAYLYPEQMDQRCRFTLCRSRGRIRSTLVQRCRRPVRRAGRPRTEFARRCGALLYNLTPAEAQIFAEVSAGRTLSDAAKSIGIAKSTARSHLLRIFEKTGCRRQAELVALASRLASPL